MDIKANVDVHQYFTFNKVPEFKVRDTILALKNTKNRDKTHVLIQLMIMQSFLAR